MAQVDWSLSVICQDVRSFRELRCSRNSCGATPEQVKYLYNSFLAILAELRDLKILQESECKLPATVTSDTRYENFAKWHKNCKWKYSEGQVQRQIDEAKRKKEEDQADPCSGSGPSRTRQCHKFDKTKCIFCQKDIGESLYKVTMLEFGQSLLDMTAQLQDTVLTVRFGDGDSVALKTKYHHSFSPNFEQDIDHGIEVGLFSGLMMMVSMLRELLLSL